HGPFRRLGEAHLDRAALGIRARHEPADALHPHEPLLEEAGDLVGARELLATRQGEAHPYGRSILPRVPPHDVAGHVAVEEIPRPDEHAEGERNRHPGPAEGEPRERAVEPDVEGKVLWSR